MDTEVVRTFLEIVNTGNFIRAAERLNVGQTMVSARIHLLEEQLGRPLFVRNKAGATLRRRVSNSSAMRLDAETAVRANHVHVDCGFCAQSQRQLP